MQRHWKSPAHPARHRRDYIIYRAVEDASPDGRTATWRKKYFGEYTSSRCSFADLANRSIGKHEREFQLLSFSRGNLRPVIYSRSSLAIVNKRDANASFATADSTGKEKKFERKWKDIKKVPIEISRERCLSKYENLKSDDGGTITGKRGSVLVTKSEIDEKRKGIILRVSIRIIPSR